MRLDIVNLTALNTAITQIISTVCLPRRRERVSRMWHWSMVQQSLIKAITSSHPPPQPSCLPFLSVEMRGWSRCLRVVGTTHVTDWPSIHTIKWSRIWIIAVCCLATLVACARMRWRATSVPYDIMRRTHTRTTLEYRLINMITTNMLVTHLSGCSHEANF